MTKKLKLAYDNKKKERPPEGSPELSIWLDERAKEFADFLFDENREVPELDPDTHILCGSWDFLYQSEEELDAENESMEKADEERRRAHLKVVKTDNKNK
ncbi:hypothetical protein [Pseudocolwellia agarivorans]|uniref:hypothetical protein n=1 Tax=Pseudocolwellia agarivorans TaxID=1911682 RepID=UPI000985F336|nr:hypothetical protein [Pseudocolwellia agarivorans]